MKIPNTFLLPMLILLSAEIYSKELKYKVSDIPAVLKENAKVVVRNEEIELSVESLNKAVETVKYTITILNENGLEEAIFKETYNKFIKVGNINAVIYNAQGEQIKKIKDDEIKDIPDISGYSLYEDNRIKYIDPKVRSYPFTIEYTYEKIYKTLFFLPDWSPCSDYNVSVENSIFKVRVAKDIRIRFFEKNLEGIIEKLKQQDSLMNIWQLKNFKAYEEEPYSSNISEYAPAVLLAPNMMEFDGYKGDFESWEKIGLWFNKINENRDQLPEETISKMHELTKDAQNENEKIKRIYNYLQNRTRYVSIQIGIGGWQAFDAETVDRLGYGDCKALTNYLKALLKSVGISSNYTIAEAGENAPLLIKDFPGDQFDHVCLTVPLKNDTVYLECTDQLIPFGFIGDFTDDRNVLLITENGGKIIHTPKYSINDNLKSRNAKVSISSDGNGNAIVSTLHKCIFYDKIYTLIRENQEEKKRELYQRIHIPSFSIDSFAFKESKEQIPFINEFLALKLNNYATVSGNRIFIPLNLMNRLTDVPKKSDTRKSDVIVRRSFQNIDTITYKLPHDYKIENIPQGKSLITPFGEYQYSIRIKDNNEAEYIRIFKLFKGNYPVSSYDDFVKFFEQVSFNDNAKIVLLKQ